MRERIRQLEKLSRPLEPDAGERSLLRDKVVRYAEAFLDDLPRRRAFQATDDQGIGILDSPISEEPDDPDRLLDVLAKHVDRPGVNLGTGGYLAFIPASGLYTCALADYLSSVTSRYAGVFFASPGAVRLERMLLGWMAEFVGYPETSAGDLTSGGSIANLVGVVTAREAHGLHARDFPKSVVYLSEQTHHSVEKALRIAGLEECVKRYVPLDRRFRMQPDALERAITSDRKADLKPWLLVGAAGTTDTGAVDPLGALAAIAEARGLWFHVDGAYGAMFALCESGKKVLEGIERSDSLVLDPHKGLFAPLGVGAVLVKDSQAMRRAHRYHASYMQDQDVLASPDEVSPADLSPELTRPFRGLRLWLALKLAGVAPFRAALEEKLLLARYFYHEIGRVDGFEVGPPPDLSVVTFRYVPKRGDVDEFNRKLVAAVQKDGRIFISSTTIEGNVTLRLAVLSLRTHLDMIDAAMEIIQEKVRELVQ
jgi:glutamate/tyrosine decarboxylase-like PLP-dependent enzyme